MAALNASPVKLVVDEIEQIRTDENNANAALPRKQSTDENNANARPSTALIPQAAGANMA